MRNRYIRLLDLQAAFNAPAARPTTVSVDWRHSDATRTPNLPVGPAVTLTVCSCSADEGRWNIVLSFRSAAPTTKSIANIDTSTWYNACRAQFSRDCSSRTCSSRIAFDISLDVESTS